MANTGGCLCGGVRYAVNGRLSPPVACHCSQCARTSGAFAMMASCATSDLVIEPSEALRWFRSSENIARGFCAGCGGNLFWRADPGDETYVTCGTLDAPTGLRLAAHIYVGSKADYYELADGLPQSEEW